MAAFLNPASLSTVTAAADSPDSNGENGSESEDEPLLLAVVDKREAHHEIPYFYGKSSNITLAQDVLDLKKELRGTEEKMPNPHMPECSSVCSGCFNRFPPPLTYYHSGCMRLSDLHF